MMTPRPAPRLIVRVIGLVHNRDDAIGTAALACAGSLLAMMAVQLLVAWQVGLL